MQVLRIDFNKEAQKKKKKLRGDLLLFFWILIVLQNMRSELHAQQNLHRQHSPAMLKLG